MQVIEVQGFTGIAEIAPFWSVVWSVFVCAILSNRKGGFRCCELCLIAVLRGCFDEWSEYSE